MGGKGVCRGLMSPAHETQSMREIRLLRGRLLRKGGGLTGMSLKRKTTESDDKQEKTKKYEENRKASKLNVKWLTNREWLDYDESNDIMTCKIWQR